METILKVSNLKKNMGGRKIIDDVSFETYAGEVFGFLGPNGAGKTTTIKMIMGLLDIDEGHIEICGFDNVRHFEKAMECVGGI
ncbi:MAG TPA: bacitracin ABC transporter ATP-binding protein, partial [Ruminococcaceae bacterium]|nr:bacitracin ABC transporter ATP-binding protein [Oscillospiraceae bacterium]